MNFVVHFPVNQPLSANIFFRFRLKSKLFTLNPHFHYFGIAFKVIAISDSKISNFPRCERSQSISYSQLFCRDSCKSRQSIVSRQPSLHTPTEVRSKVLEFIQIGRGERERDSRLAETLSIVRSLIPVAELGIGVL